MRNKVLKIACARCSRIEYVEETPETVEPICFQGTIKGGGAKALEVCFEELCAQCAKTVRSLLENVAKKIDGASPARTRKSKTPPAGEVVQVEIAPPSAEALQHPPKGRLFGTIKTGS